MAKWARTQGQLNERLQAEMEGQGIAGPDADFTFAVNGGATLIECAWPIVNDPERPNKRSRALRVVVDRDLSDMLRFADDEDFENLLRRAIEIMAKRSERYSAEHPDPNFRGALEPFTVNLSKVDM